jgi:ribosomal protein L7/L12
MRWWWLGLAAVLLVGFVVRRLLESAEDPGSRLRPGTSRPTDADVVASLRAGRKVEAIRLYRVIHRVDLKTAKDAVEAWDRSRRIGGAR